MERPLLTRRWVVAHVAVAAIAAACVALGFWQLDRLDEKRERKALIESRTRAPVEDLRSQAPALPAREPGLLAYRRVRVAGRYDPGREVVLRARSLRGRAGNHVLTPLVTEQGYGVIVDRGWVPFDLDEPPVAQASPPAVPVSVSGTLLPTEPGARAGPGVPPRWVSRVDVARLARGLPYEVLPLSLLLEEQRPAQGGPLPVAVPLSAPSEGPHLSYAVQWFTFAGLALITYGALIRKTARRP